MNETSKRHHYIPKFLIKGFVNNDGFLYVYDKQKDLIFNKLRSPKSVFFENDRNTIINNQLRNSILEDKFYQKLDDDSSKCLIKFQYSKITPELFSEQNIGDLQFFLINLFWRIPFTDFPTKHLIDNAQNIDSEIKKDENWNKLIRANLYSETIKQMKRKKGYFFSKITEFEDDKFIIGDSPFVYENDLTKFTDLTDSDFHFALTSKRIFSFSKKPMKSFKAKMLLYYNANIIEQSKRFIASNNLELLKTSLLFYKETKEDESILKYTKHLLFNP